MIKFICIAILSADNKVICTEILSADKSMALPLYDNTIINLPYNNAPKINAFAIVLWVLFCFLLYYIIFAKNMIQGTTYYEKKVD